MTSWMARKVVREPAFFERVPDVLVDWVAYAGLCATCHRRRSTRQSKQSPPIGTDARSRQRPRHMGPREGVRARGAQRRRRSQRPGRARRVRRAVQRTAPRRPTPPHSRDAINALRPAITGGKNHEHIRGLLVILDTSQPYDRMATLSQPAHNGSGHALPGCISHAESGCPCAISPPLAPSGAVSRDE